MRPLKKTLITALVFLSSFSSYFATAEEAIFSPSSLEWRLQQLTAEKEVTQRLHHLFDLYWDWRMAENPDEASYLGYAGGHDRWPDLSPTAIARRQHFTSQLLDVLSSIQNTDLEQKDKLNYHILQRILTEDQLYAQFDGHYLLVNQMHGIHLNVPLILEFMPTKTLKDYENILARLRRLPEFFQQTLDLLDQGIEAGITPPRIAMLNVPQQILNQMVEDPSDSPLLKAFKHFPSSIDADTQNRLWQQASIIYQNDIFPTLSRFYSYMTHRYLPHCRKTTAWSDLPKGKEWYAHHIQCETTTPLTAQEIHTIGLKEVERIYQEMLTIIKTTEFKGSFQDFLHFLKTDPQFFYPNRQELLHGYQTLTRHIEAKLPLLFTHLPSLPFEVLPVPAYSEESQIAAYYYPGSVSERRPGYFFINTSYPEQRPKWEMEPLALHEAVPGHHLQITLAQELQSLPEFRKHTNFTAYIEGWGLYAESLGSELGLYQDPYAIFGRLSYEMLRAIRLVVDTGMHSMGWSREQAIDFFKQYVGMSDHEIVTEVDRYLVLPGQALAYKIGEIKIQEMRRWAAQQLGERFDIREFHRVWLQNGTVPLDMAEQNIREWVDQSIKREDNTSS